MTIGNKNIDRRDPYLKNPHAALTDCSLSASASSTLSVRSFSLEDFKENFQIKIVEKTKDSMIFDMVRKEFAVSYSARCNVSLIFLFPIHPCMCIAAGAFGRCGRRCSCSRIPVALRSVDNALRSAEMRGAAHGRSASARRSPTRSAASFSPRSRRWPSSA